MPDQSLILDHIYQHEAAQPDKVFLTQPIGGGQAIDYTWGQVLDQARRMAAHLQGYGFAPGARIAMLAKNSAHFFMAELAIWMSGCTTVAIFPTETAENLRYVLDHSEAGLLFVGKLDSWPQQAAAVRSWALSGARSGRPCIALPLAPDNDFERWDDIVARTAALTGRPARAADDLAMLLYTSGSTGQPKGVMQSFGRITHATACRNADAKARLAEQDEWRMLSYLPLAHAYERAALQCAALMDGRGRIFFGHTLNTFMDDIKRARPTLFLSVPRLWLKFQQAVFATLPPDKLDALLADPATAPAVRQRVLAGLGLDAVRTAASGSAPIPPALVDWYRSLGLNMIEGYGMTEDFAYSHRTTDTHNASGHVGIASTGVEVRLADDGEVLIKSPGQMVGYYKRPDLDREVFTADGFFRTGDLGQLRDDGQLKITGRVKELFKTAKGEYVAPAPIENRLNVHPMVESSMVSGVGQQAAYAVLVLDENLRPKLGDAAERERVTAALAQLLAEVNQALAPHEQLQMLVVAREPWTIENGCLTPTMKIKRHRIESAVAAQVDAWYAAPGPVLWA